MKLEVVNIFAWIKTNKVFSIREFLLQEIISDKDRDNYEKWLKQAAKYVYDIRDDVRV